MTESPLTIINDVLPIEAQEPAAVQTAPEARTEEPALFVKQLGVSILPKRGTPLAAGLDLYANDWTLLEPGVPTKVPTGIAVEMPEGYFGMIATRSSIALKNLTVFTTIVDPDYRGEIFITVRNDGKEPYGVAPCDRLAQLVVIPYHDGPVLEVRKLSKTQRGKRGYGSTGR